MILVVATHNLKKGAEMRAILRQRLPQLEIKTLADYPGAPEPEETAHTYAENAAIKAVSAARFTGEWCVADDAGLEIDALGGAPGHLSKRFGGEGMPFGEKIARILELMSDVPEERRTARFRCCVAVTAPLGLAPGLCLSRLEGPAGSPRPLLVESSGPPTFVFESTCEGRIAFEPRGSGGFGYDPVFVYPELGRTFAELSPEEKHAVSHRGKVLKKLADWLPVALAAER